MDWKAFWEKHPRIPDYMHKGIELYVDEHITPGDFLLAVLSNDIVGSVQRADINNMNLLNEYGNMLEDLPAQCWGSKDVVYAWLNARKVPGVPE